MSLNVGGIVRMITNKKLIDELIKCDWGCYHLFGNFYLAKKYSPATKGIKGYIWTIDYARGGNK